MLPNETEEVRECLRRAEECARQAKAQFDTKFRQATPSRVVLFDRLLIPSARQTMTCLET